MQGALAHSSALSVATFKSVCSSSLPQQRFTKDLVKAYKNSHSPTDLQPPIEREPPCSRQRGDEVSVEFLLYRKQVPYLKRPPPQVLCSTWTSKKSSFREGQGLMIHSFGRRGASTLRGAH